MPVVSSNLPICSDRNKAWDASSAKENVAKWASSDGSGDKDKIDWDKYAQAFLWRADGASNFGDFKLPFADVDDGTLEAVWKGVHSAAGVVQGAMGGVDVPDADIPKIKSQIEKYYKKAAAEFKDDTITVPWKRSAFATHPDILEFERRYGQLGGIERRVIPLEAVETRDNGTGGYSVTGYASVYNMRSLDLGGFTEVIEAGAFDDVLSRNPDVHLLWDHDTKLVLARTRNNTLHLKADDHGLNYYGKVAPTSYAADLRILLDRGDIDQASFAFTVGEQSWEIDERDGVETVLRRILRVDELYDATITAMGAYPAATSGIARAYVRSYAGFEQAEVEVPEIVVPEVVERSNKLALSQSRARARARVSAK